MSDVIHGAVFGCGWAPGDTYTCARCLRTCCYCFGCGDEVDDALGGVCDDCWYAISRVGADNVRWLSESSKRPSQQHLAVELAIENGGIS